VLTPYGRNASAALPRIAWAKLMARGEEFALECPGRGGDMRLIAFMTKPGPIRKILTHLGEPLEALTSKKSGRGVFQPPDVPRPPL
jgi:hypothetical protein